MVISWAYLCAKELSPGPNHTINAWRLTLQQWIPLLITLVWHGVIQTQIWYPTACHCYKYANAMGHNIYLSIYACMKTFSNGMITRKHVYSSIRKTILTTLKKRLKYFSRQMWTKNFKGFSSLEILLDKRLHNYFFMPKT